MKTKTNQTLRLTTMAAITVAASEWLHSENCICSAIMQKPVTNLQLLHIYHVGTPALLGLCCNSLFATVILFAWSAAAYTLAKKGGRA